MSVSLSELPATRFTWRLVLGIVLAVGILLASGIAAYAAHDHEDYGREASFMIIAGLAFGIILQRARFCFFCILREAIEERETRPLIGVIGALAVGTLGSVAVFGAWLPDATAGHLPPTGNIGPVGWPLVLGAFSFGLGMTFSGSCISAHLYRLGEGSWLSLVALLGVAGGFALGFHAWTPLYLSSYISAPVIWLPGRLGFAWATVLQLAVFALLALGLWKCGKWRAGDAKDEGEVGWSLYDQLWRARWSIGIPAVLIGLLATLVLLRAEPLGVTSALGGLTRSGLAALHWIPERLEGLDGLRGCKAEQQESWLSLNALFVLALVLGASAASFGGGHFQPERLLCGGWFRHCSAGCCWASVR